MTTKKITKKDNLTDIIALTKAAAEAGIEGFDFDEIKTFAEKEIDNLDKRAAKAKERAATKKAETDTLKETIFATLNSETFLTINNIVAAIDDEEVTNGKVASRLTALRNEGRVESEDIKVDKRVVKGYRVIAD